MIDTSPDLREQLIQADVDHIDAVFLTHEHADQTHGIDDLRPVVMHQRRRIPVYLNKATADHVLLRFSYCFVAPPGSDYPPILDHRPVEAGERRSVEGKGGTVTLSAFLLQHGKVPALGYRIGNAAYTPDLSDIPRESWPSLENLELWIVDGLRYNSHPSHFSVNDALSWIDRIQTEAGGHHQHAFRPRLRGAARSLPEGVIPAYDGMRLTLDQAASHAAASIVFSPRRRRPAGCELESAAEGRFRTVTDIVGNLRQRRLGVSQWWAAT